VVEDLRKTNEQSAEGACCAMARFTDPAYAQPVVCDMFVGLRLNLRPALERLRSQHAAL
jgi:hypothetical protein